MRPRLLAQLLVAAACLAAPAAAQERILSYDSEVDIRDDGSLEVAEHITVRAEGRNIRRGIYRDFPTRYRDRFGNRVRVDLEVLGVERDGQPEPWFTEGVANGVRINTGDDSFLAVPAEYTFTIRYRTTRQLGFFDDHDELYWNAIGTGWIFPIERGAVDVSLPRPVPVDSLAAEGYTGRQGAQGTSYAATLPAAGSARYALTEALAPGEGLTIVLSFPKGVVDEPTTSQRIRWFFGDNAGVLVALAGLVGLLVFCFRRWSAIGRDPPPGVIIPRYEPRPDETPGAARYLRRMGYDDRCFSADALDLAVGGHLRIHREGKGRKGTWLLEHRTPVAASRAFGQWETDPSRQGLGLPGGSPVPPGASQRVLLHRLFKHGGALLELDTSNATTLQGAKSAHRQALDHELHGRYFRRNGATAARAFLITAGTAVLAVVLSGGSGIPFILLIVVLMIATSAIFHRLVRAPTPEGRARIDEIEGLRLYMSVAERDELASMRGPGSPPPLDAARYEALLPFAVALEVEDAWTDRFTAAVGAAAAAEAARGMGWYVGRGPVTDLASFSRSLGSGLSSQIASASTPPGSSSGGGGGGFSGGGGGGGGGGGR